MQSVVYSVSCRDKDPKTNLRRFFRSKYPTLDKTAIDMVFGFVESSPLYGGRLFNNPELSDNDVAYLYAHNIGLKIPVSNHFASEQEYEQSLPLLEKYHRQGNGLAIVNDDLAKWVRRDFPKYELEASVIKNIHKQEQIDKALELYDVVVLPMDMCLKPDVLKTFEPKQKIRLFVNAGCALTCPARMCYRGISKDNKYSPEDRPFVANCSKDKLAPRDDSEFMDFDVEQLQSLGYSKFKMLRSKGTGGGTGF